VSFQQKRGGFGGRNWQELSEEEQADPANRERKESWEVKGGTKGGGGKEGGAAMNTKQWVELPFKEGEAFEINNVLMHQVISQCAYSIAVINQYLDKQRAHAPGDLSVCIHCTNTHSLTLYTHTLTNTLQRDTHSLTNTTHAGQADGPILSRILDRRLDGLTVQTPRGGDGDVYCTHCTHCTHCTLHTAHCTLHTAHCTLHTAHCILHTAHSLSTLSFTTSSTVY
jgi:hypothetical protein